jgi:phosphoadenosine phosphosulfate reductase
MSEAIARQLDQNLAALPMAQRLQHARTAMPGRIVFTTSFGLEDQVLTHHIAASGIDIAFVTLDTGRLFPETYTLWAQTERRYGYRIQGFNPDAEQIESLVAEQGIDGFYGSVAARKACCAVRKTHPLRRALVGAAGWMTGLRADQSPRRAGLGFASLEADHGLIKLNPLLDWSRQQAADFAAQYDIPVNPLHASGFASIGCAPCTRAIHPSEPERAGRWWWEDDGQQECGLHVATDGTLKRATASPDIFT